MEEIILFLEEIMELDDGVLSKDTVLSDLEEWDSLTALSLIIEGRKRYGKEIKTSNIVAFKTVEDICEFLR